MSVSVGLVGANVAAAAIAVRAAQAMAPAAPVDVGEDAELIAMCDQWRRFCRVHEHTLDRSAQFEVSYKGRFELLQGIADQIHDHRMEPLAKAIADRPSASWAGVTAKARVLASDQAFAGSGEPGDIFVCLEPLVLSIAKDAVRLGGHGMPQSSSPQWEV